MSYTGIRRRGKAGGENGHTREIVEGVGVADGSVALEGVAELVEEIVRVTLNTVGTTVVRGMF